MASASELLAIVALTVLAGLIVTSSSILLYLF